MKTVQQKKLVYLVGALILAGILASSQMAWKYPDHTGSVGAGLVIFAVLLGAVALFMIRRTNAA